MNRPEIKNLLKQEEIDEKDMNKLLRYWDTILLWSGFICYLSYKEIARYQKIGEKTVKRRLNWFNQQFPEAYSRIRDERAAIRSASCKLDGQINNFLEGHFLSYSDDLESFVKEKF